MTFGGLLGRRRGTRGPSPSMIVQDEATAVLAAAHRNALLREYREGLAHGIRMTLTLLLGEASDGGEPFPGPLPSDVEAWARTALARVNAEAPR